MVDQVNHVPDGAEEWHPENREGAHVSEYTDFSQPEARQQLNETLESKEYANVRRFAGLGIHTVAMGDLDIDSLVKQIAANPDTVWLCIDEHSQIEHEAGTLCPHAGCGAADGIHGALKAGDKTVTDNISAIMGKKVVNSVLNDTISPDQLGVLWAEELQRRLSKLGAHMNIAPVGVERYEHHGHPIHSATGAAVFMNAEKQSNYMPGKPGEKPFFYTNTDTTLSDRAVSNAAREAALASAIAAGGHGLGAELKTFMIMVHDLPQVKRDLFEQEVQRYHAAFASGAKVEVVYEN